MEIAREAQIHFDVPIAVGAVPLGVRRDVAVAAAAETAQAAEAVVLRAVQRERQVRHRHAVGERRPDSAIRMPLSRRPYLRFAMALITNLWR